MPKDGAVVLIRSHDLISMDGQMPVLDGCDATPKLRELGSLKPLHGQRGNAGRLIITHK